MPAVGSYDLDSRKFTLVRDGQTLSGPAAVAESKRCLTRGITLGVFCKHRSNLPRTSRYFSKPRSSKHKAVLPEPVVVEIRAQNFRPISK